MAPTPTTTEAAAEQQQQLPRKALGLAAHDASGHLTPIRISRRNTGDDDVAIKVLYCGICHSDLHTIKNDWKNAIYPVVAGHEITGLVTEVGKKAEGSFKAGDRVGVGCMVNSCRSCESCEEGSENYCSKVVFSYNSLDRDGTVTRGGDPAEMKAAAGTMHGIINTACAGGAVSMYQYFALLRPHGKMILVGLPEKPLQVPAFALVGGGKTLAGSFIGSVRETQEMLDFAAEHGVAADVEVIGAGEVNTAMERLAKGDVRYRFVIDVGNTLKAD